MGIKGIYAELGPGKRISLAKLAADKLEETGRPLRLAIDISIWQFQIQAAKGGTNPAERTLFYRLARLLSHAIEPIFVFDGPQKPVFKRNKRSGRMDTATNASAKRLLKLFGCMAHDAPGEAEAECALLQRQGIVDAVLSEDVDTIMFGCTKTLRNWTAETKSGKTPTHVSSYDVNDDDFRKSGLDREGMVLVALMSGGDYIPEGIPGCGPKVACEAARAGFGASLCKIKRADEAGLRRWKESLVHELRTNESRFFKRRHMALAIPEDFPKLDVLRYYTHPVVSEASRIEKLKADGILCKPVDMAAMRHFVEETFDWTHRIGADKLIRVIAPSLLVQKLMERYSSRKRELLPRRLVQEESALVKKIASRRAHHSTDGVEELRVHYVPADIAGLDLSMETDEAVSFGRDGLALNSDDDFEDDGLGDGKPTKKRFDPTQTDAVWIPQCIVKVGAPLKAEEWEDTKRKKLSHQAKPVSTRRRAKAKATEAPTATLDNWIVQDGARIANVASLERRDASDRTTSPKKPSRSLSQGRPAKDYTKERKAAEKTSVVKPRKSKQPKHRGLPPDYNPWSISGSQNPPRVTKRSTTTSGGGGLVEDPILLSSSPPPQPATPEPLLPPQSPAALSADVAATPRLRLPSDTLDTPSWLKSSPVNSSPKRGMAKKQTTPHSFISSPVPDRTVDRADKPASSKPTLLGHSGTKMKATSSKSQSARTLFPITKKTVTSEAVSALKVAAKPRKVKMHGYIFESDSDVLSSLSDDEDGGALLHDPKPNPGLCASVIDLTQDDD